MALLVSIATLGALMATMYSGPRVMFVAAREGALPEALSGMHNRFKTPAPALIFQVSG